MLITILYIFYTLTYAALPFLYKSRRPSMIQFICAWLIAAVSADAIRWECSPRSWCFTSTI